MILGNPAPLVAFSFAPPSPQAAESLHLGSILMRWRPPPSPCSYGSVHAQEARHPPRRRAARGHGYVAYGFRDIHVSARRHRHAHSQSDDAGEIEVALEWPLEGARGVRNEIVVLRPLRPMMRSATDGAGTLRQRGGGLAAPPPTDSYPRGRRAGDAYGWGGAISDPPCATLAAAGRVSLTCALRTEVRYGGNRGPDFSTTDSRCQRGSVVTRRLRPRLG